VKENIAQKLSHAFVKIVMSDIHLLKFKVTPKNETQKSAMGPIR
jgi:hypothetical protein